MKYNFDINNRAFNAIKNKTKRVEIRTTKLGENHFDYGILKSGDEIESIASSITSQTFSTDSTYNNKWGFKPAQYVTTSGGIDTVVNNTDFLPAPSGLVLGKTSAANSTANTYSFSFGTRIDMNLPAGTYTGTYVLTAVANPVIYNIAYDENVPQESEADHANSMPVPNPQVVSIDGGTPVAESYATLSSAVPTLPDMTFDGWCDEIPTLNTTTDNYECLGTTYQPGGQYL